MNRLVRVPNWVRSTVTRMSFCATLSLSQAASGDSASLTDPAAVLTPIAVYARCYATITRTRLLLTQRYAAPVTAGTLDPVAACMQVLSDSAFGNTSPDPVEQNNVIQALSDFHRTWFTTDAIGAGLPNDERFPYVPEVYSGGAPANYLTRWALTPNLPYSYIVTESSGLLAVRANGAPVPNVPFAASAPSGAVVNYAPPILNTGDITNIQRMADNPVYANFTINGVSEWPYPIMPFQSYGGGIIGSQEFLMLNYGRTLEDNDGGFKVPRRWAKAIMNDLMCRNIPMIQSSDVTSQVDLSSPYPFRQSASCLTCHYTLDSMADTAANIRFTNLEAYTQPGGIEPMVSYPTTGTSFAQSPPSGMLFYRSYDNSVVNLPLTDVNSLGAALATTNDLYVCAASRYLEYFTGVHVNLDGALNGAILSQTDAMFLQLVIAAGANLKTNGSLTMLLTELLNNDFYKTTSMRPSMKVQD